MTNSPPKPTRVIRGLRFSLRTFFVLLTIFCLVFGWRINRARLQELGVEGVRNSGGLVVYDFQLGGDGQTGAPGYRWMHDLLGIDFFADVVLVDYRKGPIQDVSPVARLPWLNVLILSDTQVSDVRPLAELSGLESLVLNNTPVQDISPLKDLTNLQTLFLAGTHVNDVSPLVRLRKLDSLLLYDTQVSDLTPLAQLTNLKMLFLGNTPVHDVRPLTRLYKLEWLALNDTLVEDVLPLSKLARLKRLELGGTRISQNDCDALQYRLPNCTISYRPAADR
jgi:Leucine-rich repeat (LRR) protein